MREYWNDCFSEENFPSIVFTSDLDVRKICSDVLDGGNSFNGTWQTPDFVLPELYAGHNGRWLELEFESKSYIRISHSVDQGNSWSSSVLYYSNNWSTHKYYLDITSPYIRFQVFSSANYQWKLRWLRLWGTPEGVL